MSDDYDNGAEAASGWIEYRLAGPLPAIELFAEFMTEMGAGGAVFSECPEKRGTEMVTVFLPANRYSPGAAARIKTKVFTLSREFPGNWGELDITKVEDRDWTREWRESLEPERMQPGIWIVPTFKEVPDEVGEEPVIRMDPGLAFGTGKHETTRMCVEATARAVKEGAKTVLDLGTGTGILAMVAALMGAESVLAMDLDTLALKVAEDNIATNGLTGKIRLDKGVAEPDHEIGSGPFDLVIANIFAESLVNLMPFINKNTKPDGLAVLSGILSERADMVKESVASEGMELTKESREGEWVTLEICPANR